MRYTFTLELEVSDAARLYEAAKALAIEDKRELSGPGREDIKAVEEMLGTPENINVRACIEMMLDPGKSQPGMEVMRCSVAPSRPSGPTPRP
jgi:hypothetical protein